VARQSSGSGGEPEGDSDLARRGRMIRLVLSAVAVALLLYGSVAGRDNMWPFGPFSMYAGYYPPNGVISSNLLVAETADGRTVYPGQSEVGVARADIEGELGVFRANPDLLGDLAATFRRRNPAASPYVRVWIQQTRWQLHDRAVVDTSSVTLVEWDAP
jgi:hypothetical protein